MVNGKENIKMLLTKEPRQKMAELEKSETRCERAEETLQRQTGNLQELSDKDVQSLVHELQLHQIELEMQNEELRRAQNELEESRNRYSDLYDFAPIGYFTFDKNGLILEVNLTGANKLGVERSFLIKKLFSPYIVPDSKNVFYSHLMQVFKTEGVRQTCELKLVDKNRNQFYAQLESQAVKDSEGNFSRCRTAISDITERKRIEEAISLLASIVASSDDAIIGKTLDGIILSWNYGAQKMCGYSADEVKGGPISILISPDHPNSPNEVLQILERIRQGQRIEHYETLLKIKDGRRISVSLTISPIKDATGKIIGASTIARDISERKRMEEELFRAHDELEIRVQERTAELFEANKAIQKGISKLEKTDFELGAEIVKRKKAEQAEQNARVYAESIVETLRESLVVLDEQLRIVIANQTFYKTFKASLEETVNKFIYDLGNGQWNIPALKELLEEIILKNTQFQDFEVEHEFPSIGRKMMLLNARQIYQRDINKPLILLAIEDITEKKKLESQLLSAQRMESVGTLASGIAHDINNVLTPIMLSQQLLQERLTDEESQRLLNTIERSTHRGANLMKQVLSFTKGIEGDVE
jgi:PAS domain S-box-containing protein